MKLQQLFRAAARGWDSRGAGGYSKGMPLRATCRWNRVEEHALSSALRRGDAISLIAKTHQRTSNAISMRIERLAREPK